MSRVVGNFVSSNGPSICSFSAPLSRVGKPTNTLHSQPDPEHLESANWMVPISKVFSSQGCVAVAGTSPPHARSCPQFSILQRRFKGACLGGHAWVGASNCARGWRWLFFPSGCCSSTRRLGWQYPEHPGHWAEQLSLGPSKFSLGSYLLCPAQPSPAPSSGLLGARRARSGHVWPPDGAAAPGLMQEEQSAHHYPYPTPGRGDVLGV